MRSPLTRAAKSVQALRTVLGTGFTTWQTARSACRNGANQKWSELSRLLHIVRTLRPIRVLEIGIDRGGTMALWSHIAAPNAHLIGLDTKISPEAEFRIRARLGMGQSLHLIQADSHSPASKQQVLDTLNGSKLDFLFIDGDHEYEGVKQDWENYSPLVRGGGVVAFHDIVPDYESRFGRKTRYDSGGVHQLWGQIKSRCPHQEFVEDPEQNGYGIGVMYV